MAYKIFEQTKRENIQKSAFDLSHEVKMSGKMGNLMPAFVQEVLPSDQFSVRSEVFVRLAPTIAPIMHRIDVYMHYFFVPYRLVWDRWESFRYPEKADAVPPSHPTIFTGDPAKWTTGTLWDYFGLPTKEPSQTNSPRVSTLPFRAYLAIYNDYYRDQNLEDEIDFTDNANILQLRQRAYAKDYFTSAFNTPQKGAAIDIPLSAEVLYKNESDFVSLGGDGNIESQGGTMEVNGATGYVDNIEGVTTTATIEDLRRSARLQEWLEKAMRVGTRYKEAIMGFFGQDVGDARLDRPEYLGGGVTPIQISEVLQTSKSDGTQPLGELGGHGLASGSQNTFKYTCPEDGVIIGILSVLPKRAYQQGVNRMWTRFDRFDWYSPEFAHLGEQPISNQELYYSENSTDTATWGYQQIWGDMKYATNRVAGDFRDTLAFWHLGSIFSNLPGLNNDFIKADPSDFDRIFAVQDDTDTLWMQIYHDVKARRPIPFFSEPTL